jgi:hypothetical protein
MSLTLLFIAGLNCSTDLADGGTEAGNAKIIGTVVDENGTPVDNALVTLNEKTDTILHYYTVHDSLITYDTTVATDSKGVFAFDLPDSGMYHITVEKYKRFLVFIDSIHVFNKVTISLPPDTIREPGVITGTVYLNDTTGVTEKQIRVIVKEKLDYVIEIGHGEPFTFADIPRGLYGILCSPESGEFLPKWLKVEVTPGDTTDLGKIVLQKITNYLVSSNVMTADFKGLDSVPVNVIPEYTFTAAPLFVTTAKTGVYPKGEWIIVDAVINGNTVMLNHLMDFPRGKEIGIYLEVSFAGREDITIDFMTDQEKRFTTIP